MKFLQMFGKIRQRIPMRKNDYRETCDRRGAAAVEFAVCLPLFMGLMIGAIQTTDAIYLKNSLRVIAFETIREAAKPNGTNTLANDRANEILTARNVRGAVVTFDPADVSTAINGQPITVTISAPADGNTIMPGWFFNNKTIRETMTMTSEGRWTTN